VVYNATANVFVEAYINTSAIGVNGSEVINFTATGQLNASICNSSGCYSDPESLPPVSENITFNGSSQEKPIEEKHVESSVMTPPGSLDLAVSAVYIGKFGDITLSLEKKTLEEIKEEIKRQVTKFKLKHIEPGRWVLVGEKANENAIVIMYIYPHPIASGIKTVKVTFTRQ